MGQSAARGRDINSTCLHRWWSNAAVAVALPALALIPAQVAVAGTTYTYDALGRVISVRQDDGKQTVYVYDAAGNRVQSVVSGTTLNRAPVAVPDSITLFENQTTVSVDPTANDADPDGTPLALFSVASGTFGQASSTANLITYTSNWHRNGQDTVTYTISDGQGLTSSGRISVTLANLPPVAVQDSIQSPINLGRTFDPTANDTDPGSDALKVISVTTPAHGTATITQSGTGVMYLPVSNYTGADSFSYVVSDGDGGTSAGNVTVDVVSTLPPPPVATPDQVSLQGSLSTGDVQELFFDPRQNDIDPLGQWIRIVSVTQPPGGIVTIVDGGRRIRVVRAGGTTVDPVGTFSYVIEDGLGRQATAQVVPTMVWR